MSPLVVVRFCYVLGSRESLTCSLTPPYQRDFVHLFVEHELVFSFINFI